MNHLEFSKLSGDLRTLARLIPLHWGEIQNNSTDDKINMFQINNFDILEQRLEHLSEEEKNYLRRRWYLWKCSQCDEYLFYINENVEKNPNPYDKAYDIRINDDLCFDIKGTVIPKSMRKNAESVIRHPKEMIDFFYDEQSKGRRYDIQNRLFIVHHSFIDPHREFYLRCAWRSKRNIYEMFCKNTENITFYKTHNVTAGVIFILEKERNVVDYSIFGIN